VDYHSAEDDTISYKFSDELEVEFINLKNLITNKMLTGRLQDKADVDMLQKIRDAGNDE
jgi:hypothetical protein